MRVPTSHVIAALMGLSLFVATTQGAMAGGGGKGDKKKQAEGEKVDIKDLPSPVTDAAKKEVPNANWTSAQKHSTKKQGSVYLLQGTEGKYHLTLMASSSGELLRFTKASTGKKKSK